MCSLLSSRGDRKQSRWWQIIVVARKMIKLGEATECWRVEQETSHLSNVATVQMRIEWKGLCESSCCFSPLTSLFDWFSKSLHSAQWRARHHGPAFRATEPGSSGRHQMHSHSVPNIMNEMWMVCCKIIHKIPRETEGLGRLRRRLRAEQISKWIKNNER